MSELGKPTIEHPKAGEVWTLADLEVKWKAPGPTPKARRKWVLRRVKAWGVRHSGGRNPSFMPSEVLRVMQREMGGKA